MTDYTYLIADELETIRFTLNFVSGLVAAGVIGAIMGLNRIARAIEGKGLRDIKDELERLKAETAEAEEADLRAAFAAGKLHAGYDEWRASREAAL